MELLVEGVSVLVPVYNSAKMLGGLLEELVPVLDGLGMPWELILVNDGSRDNSWQEIQGLSRLYPERVRGINLMRNYGQHNALFCALQHARYSICISMDDDMQHPPQAIPMLLAKLEEGYDVVYASPQEEKHGLFRNLASMATKLVLQKAMGSDNARNISAYRVFRCRLREAFSSYHGTNVSMDVLLSWASNRFTHVKVAHRKRAEGKSNYTLRKLIDHAMNMITGYSTLPLRLSSGMGFVMAFFGVLVFLYAFIRYLIYGGVVPGFTFLASLVAIFSGAQLLVLGIMGEYLARMYFRLMDKPIYVVRDREGFND